MATVEWDSSIRRRSPGSRLEVPDNLINGEDKGKPTVPIISEPIESQNFDSDADNVNAEKFDFLKKYFGNFFTDSEIHSLISQYKSAGSKEGDLLKFIQEAIIKRRTEEIMHVLKMYVYAPDGSIEKPEVLCEKYLYNEKFLSNLKYMSEDEYNKIFKNMFGITAKELRANSGEFINLRGRNEDVLAGLEVIKNQKYSDEAINKKMSASAVTKTYDYLQMNNNFQAQITQDGAYTFCCDKVLQLIGVTSKLDVLNELSISQDRISELKKLAKAGDQFEFMKKYKQYTGVYFDIDKIIDAEIAQANYSALSDIVKLNDIVNQFTGDFDNRDFLSYGYTKTAKYHTATEEYYSGVGFSKGNNGTLPAVNLMLWKFFGGVSPNSPKTKEYIETWREKTIKEEGLIKKLEEGIRNEKPEWYKAIQKSGKTIEYYLSLKADDREAQQYPANCVRSCMEELLVCEFIRKADKDIDETARKLKPGYSNKQLRDWLNSGAGSSLDKALKEVQKTQKEAYGNCMGEEKIEQYSKNISRAKGAANLALMMASAGLGGSAIKAAFGIDELFAASIAAGIGDFAVGMTERTTNNDKTSTWDKDLALSLKEGVIGAVSFGVFSLTSKAILSQYAKRALKLKGPKAAADIVKNPFVRVTGDVPGAAVSGAVGHTLNAVTDGHFSFNEMKEEIKGGMLLAAIMPFASMAVSKTLGSGIKWLGNKIRDYRAKRLGLTLIDMDTISEYSKMMNGDSFKLIEERIKAENSAKEKAHFDKLYEKVLKDSEEAKIELKKRLDEHKLKKAHKADHLKQHKLILHAMEKGYKFLGKNIVMNRKTGTVIKIYVYRGNENYILRDGNQERWLIKNNDGLYINKKSSDGAEAHDGGGSGYYKIKNPPKDFDITKAEDLLLNNEPLSNTELFEPAYKPTSSGQNAEFNLPQGKTTALSFNDGSHSLYTKQPDTKGRCVTRYPDGNVLIWDSEVGSHTRLIPNTDGTGGMRMIKKIGNKKIDLTSYIFGNIVFIKDNLTGMVKNFNIEKLLPHMTAETSTHEGIRFYDKLVLEDILKFKNADAVTDKALLLSRTRQLFEKLPPTDILAILDFIRNNEDGALPFINNADASFHAGRNMNYSLRMEEGTAMLMPVCTLSDSPETVSHELWHYLAKKYNLSNNPAILRAHISETAGAKGLLAEVSRYAADGKMADSERGLKELISIICTGNIHGGELPRYEATRAAYKKTSRLIEENSMDILEKLVNENIRGRFYLD